MNTKADPAEAVDARKQARILRTARYYMTRYHISEDTPCRFDVVAVLGSNVRLIRDAFWCG
ncbi:MAG: YraN family protein [Clostridium fessum]